MYELETFEHEDLIARVYPDESPYNPRQEYDHFTTMVCWHSRYDLGDRKPKWRETEALERGGFPLLERYLRMTAGVVYLTPLGLLDHSGLHMYTGGGANWTDPGGWDSGTVGFAYITKAQLIDAGFEDPAQWTELIESKVDYPLGSVPCRLPRAEVIVEQEVEEYDQYLRGDIYYVTIEKKHSPDCTAKRCPHDETYDSCGGFYGSEAAEDYIKEIFGGYNAATS